MGRMRGFHYLGQFVSDFLTNLSSVITLLDTVLQ